jgi:hypothetical protein
VLRTLSLRLPAQISLAQSADARDGGCADNAGQISGRIRGGGNQIDDAVLRGGRVVLFRSHSSNSTRTTTKTIGERISISLSNQLSLNQ